MTSTRRIALALALLAPLAVAPGCRKDPEAASGAAGEAAPRAEDLDAPIAKIDDLVITVRDFQERLDGQSPYVRARYNSIEQKKEFLGKQLSLNDHDVSRVMQVQRSYSRRISELMRSGGGPGDDLRSLLSEKRSELNSLLGPESYAQYREFQRKQAEELQRSLTR
jgi:hypothetical protein